MYWAWVHRDWSATTRTVGFAAAVGGALVGAWLGFNATTGVLALVTTIVGAAAGANLTLLALDIAWDRSAHDRVADTVASPQPAVLERGGPVADVAERFPLGYETKGPAPAGPFACWRRPGRATFDKRRS